MSKNVKIIVKTGNERQIDHRADLTSCPSCSTEFSYEQWHVAGYILVLEPDFYKGGCVSVIAECPKCFKRSWTHESMDSFDWVEEWPKKWKTAVEKQEEIVRLQALRDWGAGLCHSCKHLESGSIKYHTRRNCTIGSGPVEIKCEKYETIL